MTYRQWRINGHSIIGIIGICLISIFFLPVLLLGSYLASYLPIDFLKNLPDFVVIFVIVLYITVIFIPLIYLLFFYPLRLFSEYQSRRYRRLLLSGYEIVGEIIKKQERKLRYGTREYGIYYRFTSYDNEVCEGYEDINSAKLFNSLQEEGDIVIIISRDNPHDFCTKDFYPGKFYKIPGK